MLLLFSCVVPYGEHESTAAVSQTQAVDSQKWSALAGDFDAMMADAIDIDRRDRLQAAWELSRALEQGADLDAVVNYLGQIKAIEERSQPTSMDTEAIQSQTFTPVGSTIEEEDLGQ